MYLNHIMKVSYKQGLKFKNIQDAFWWLLKKKGYQMQKCSCQKKPRLDPYLINIVVWLLVQIVAATMGRQKCLILNDLKTWRKKLQKTSPWQSYLKQ